MKKKHLTYGLLAALLTASLGVSAASKSQDDFAPTVIYQDADYIAKHQTSSSSATVSTPSFARESANTEVASKADKPAVQAADQSSQNYWVGIIVVAMAGFMFWVKRSESAAEAKAPVVRAAAESTVAASGSAGETGVAKYMRSLGIASAGAAAATGVARYLKELESTAKSAATTGVAKYLKNLDSSR